MLITPEQLYFYLKYENPNSNEFGDKLSGINFESFNSILNLFTNENLTDLYNQYKHFTGDKRVIILNVIKNQIKRILEEDEDFKKFFEELK